MSQQHPVEPGQVWQDCDKRAGGRQITVVSVDATHAECREVAYNQLDGIVADLPGARKTRIRLDRFRPVSTGYRLVRHADGTEVEQ